MLTLGFLVVSFLGLSAFALAWWLLKQLRFTQGALRRQRIVSESWRLQAKAYASGSKVKEVQKYTIDEKGTVVLS